MKSVFLSIFAVFCCFSVFSQIPDTLLDVSRSGYYRLKPIEKRLGFFQSNYFYGGKRIRTPYAAQIPFQELDDDIVNRRFRTYHALNVAAGVVSFVPLAYVLLGADNIRANGPRTFWIVTGGSVVAIIGCGIGASVAFDRAVDRYNTVVLGGKTGKVSLGVAGAGMGLCYSF
jgi:hypothetical protein